MDINEQTFFMGLALGIMIGSVLRKYLIKIQYRTEAEIEEEAFMAGYEKGLQERL